MRKFKDSTVFLSLLHFSTDTLSFTLVHSSYCRVQPWTSCSHTLYSASGLTTLWRYINQF